MESAVFALAFTGYLGLALCTIAWARAGVPRWLGVVTAAIVGVHVAGVWTVRYGGSPARALQNGWAAFLIFHTALGLVLAGAVVPERWRGRAFAAALPIVTAGALGAAFTRPEVALYRWPLVVAAAATVVITGRAVLRGRGAE